MGSLSDRVAIVTGASRGIGAAIAVRLAAEGAAVALTARTLEAHPRLPGTLRETLEAVEKGGGRAIAVPGDLQDPEVRARVVAEARERLGPVDVLVNNAAASFYIPFLEVTDKRYRVAFELNVHAPWDLAQRVLPGMKERGEGWIVNVSSATANHPQGPPYTGFYKHGGAVLYGATKAALDRITTGLAAELYDDGIAVNAISPVAAVMTPGAEALGVVPDEQRRDAEPVENVVEAALALCEPRDPRVTGRVLTTKPFLRELGRPVRTLDGLGLL